ncbi:MAG: hypothetical protein J0H95_05870 [Xanthomonadales bacterium]|nr:hypothetical protein [Xanthomonadales bacterium]MBN8794964.1 hypothetical protein [Stenotrophomonas nitritireducens]
MIVMPAKAGIQLVILPGNMESRPEKRLIESLNPAWKELWPKIIGDTHDIGKAGFPPSRE